MARRWIAQGEEPSTPRAAMIEILISSEVKSHNVQLETRSVAGVEQPYQQLMIGGYSVKEILSRADQVIQAAEKIKSEAEKLRDA